MVFRQGVGGVWLFALPVDLGNKYINRLGLFG
jgi:hypothetical protein